MGNNFSSNYRLVRLKKSENVTILNLHRVAKNDGSSYVPLHPYLFEELLKFIKSNFQVVTFNNIKENSTKPKIILSFDDGYKDFIDIACPLLYKYGIRANQNIIPACIESQLPPLNVMAQDFVGKAPIELIKQLKIPGFKDLSNHKLGFRISNFIKQKSFEQQETLRDILSPQFFSWNEFKPTLMMNKSEILQAGSIHEMGAHSYSHASMLHERDEYLIDDLNKCKIYFKKLFGHPMNIYAFPNGKCSEKQIEIVKNAGVEHVLLLEENFDNCDSPHCRFTFDAINLNEMRFKATGNFKKPKL